MSETIGRVDFIADLDGRNLPRKARIVGEQIGKETGKGFQDSFDKSLGSTFERKLTNLGDRFARSLSKQGRLAGSKFSDDFESAVSTKFRQMQSNLADVLSNREAFQDFARGFDSVDEAVDRLNTDLKSLVNQQYVKYVDENGKVHKGNVLSASSYLDYASSVRTLGEEFRAVLADEKALADGERFMDAERAHAAEETARLIEESNRRAAESMERLQDRHRLLTHRVGDLSSFQRYARQLGTNTAAQIDLRLELDDLTNRLGLSASEHSILAERIDATTSAARRASFGIFDLSERWQGLGHNTRQWTLIIGAVAAGMQDLAVLSSAAGAGLFALGGGLTAGAAGLGGFVAAFSVLNKEVGDLPPHMRGVVTQFDEFKSSATGVRDVIASAAFREMPDSFSKLSRTTEALYPAFARLGTVVGSTFDDLADGLKEGTPGFTELNRLIAGSAQDFPLLARATGTWGTALMRALNEGNPLTEQLLGYIQKLGDRFDAFTQRDSFGQWVQTSMQTWTEFGELLDATGRMLNDLVTPESAVRTQEFLDNLTEFMPNLGKMLDVLGRLDIFGLLAEALNDVGIALEPLYPATSRLADSFSDLGHVGIDVLAGGLRVVAAVATPAAEALADLLDALPPEVVVGVTGAVLGLVAATKLLQGASALAGAANAALIASGSFGNLAAATGIAESATSRWGDKLRGLAGKAGLIGGIALAVGLAIPALKNWGDELNGFNENAVKAAAGNKSLEASVKEVVAGNSMYSKSFTDARSALEQLVEVQNGGDFSRWIGDLGQANRESYALSLALGKMDEAMQGMSVEDQSAKFQTWANSVNATEEEVIAMLAEMPQFSAALSASAKATGEIATAQDLARMAMDGGRTAAVSQQEVIDSLTGSLSLNAGEVDALSAKLAAFAEQHLVTRSAARDFEASIDDLTDSLAENGATLDIGTEAGRRNEEAIDRVAEATMRSAEETRKQTGSQSAANDVINKGRDALLNQLAAFGITGQKAQDYVNKLGLIPGDVRTEVALRGVQAAKDALNEITKDRTARVYVKVLGAAAAAAAAAVAGATPRAAGGTVYGPEFSLIGEAGPEAVVPLNRPLSQVDPSVRMLSAIAQGKTAHLASGGVVGGGNKVIFEAGAIVVQGADDPRRAALEVADAIAERIGS